MYFGLLLNDDLAVLDDAIKQDVYNEVSTAVDTRVNAIIDPKTTSEHEIGALNFLREARVNEVQEENDVLASYGPIQLDCDCDAGTRNDFRACVPIDNKDVSFILAFWFWNKYEI